MKTKPTTYLWLAIIGFACTWYFILQYLLGGGSFLPAPFMTALTANALATSVTIDIYLAALVFSIWLFKDAKENNITNPWLYIALTFAVGLCVAWPLYLHVRQSKRSAK